MLRRLAFAQRDPEVVVDPEVCRESLLGASQERQGSGVRTSLVQTHFQHEQGFRRLLGDIDLACQLLHRLAVIFLARSARPGAKGRSLPGQAPA